MQNTRQRLISFRAVLAAWLIGATVFLVTNLVLMPSVFEVSAEVILRYIASLGMGQEVLLDESTTPLIVGVFVHYLLALVFSLLIIFVIFRWGFIVGVILGGILGLAIYFINLYVMTLFFDWFFATESIVFLASHVLFGATVGGVYELLDAYDTPFITEGVA